jgi:DNA-binding HxlR family transcriptional regulator
MDNYYTEIVTTIKKHLKKKYAFRLINKLTGVDYTEGRNKLSELIPGLSEDTWETLIEKMYDDGYIAKDDGRTVTFTDEFVVG